MRSRLENGVQVTPHPYLAIGQRVSIRGGPLAGWTGISVRQKSQYRLVVSVDLIQRSVSAEVEIFRCGSDHAAVPSGVFRNRESLERNLVCEGVSMNILILGGDGYLGWPTAMYLSRRGHRVGVLDNFAKRRWEMELNVEPLMPIRTLHDRVEAWRELNRQSNRIICR